MVASKAKMLQSDPSSCKARISSLGFLQAQLSIREDMEGGAGTHALCAVIESPDGRIEIDFVTECIGEGGSFGSDGRGHGGLEEVHSTRVIQATSGNQQKKRESTQGGAVEAQTRDDQT